MDTDAIYSAVCSYGTAKHRCWESDAEDTLSDIKRLLNEADEEHKSLLAENERLVDEVAELIAERDALTSELERIKALRPVAWRSSMGHGVTLKETLTDEQKSLTWAGKPMWQPLIALGRKT